MFEEKDGSPQKTKIKEDYKLENFNDEKITCSLVLTKELIQKQVLGSPVRVFLF